VNESVGCAWRGPVRDGTVRDVPNTQRRVTTRYGAAPVNSELNSLFAHFAHELKRLRTKRGWSQEALGKRIGFSGEMVSKIETGRNAPSVEFADALDRLAFPELEGLFSELLDSAGDWQFRTYADAEQHASVIRMANPLLVPGLLQTEGYIRAVHEAWRAVDGNPKIDADVAARLERQSILDRELPPSLGVVIDESVLYRPVGGATVMHDQLVHLLEMSERPRVSVQVLPSDVGAHVGLLGAFVILSFPDDGPGMVFFESPDHGETTRDTKRLARAAVTYDTLRDNALSARASRDLIRKVAHETWTPQAAPPGERAPTAAAAAASA
jgi:transcriptional regulator with XRE-family HTH domain